MPCPRPGLWRRWTAPIHLCCRPKTTVTALQALALVNNHFVLRRAQTCGSSWSVGTDVSQQIAVFIKRPSAGRLGFESKPVVDYASQHGLTNTCRFNTSELHVCGLTVMNYDAPISPWTSVVTTLTNECLFCPAAQYESASPSYLFLKRDTVSLSAISPLE